MKNNIKKKSMKPNIETFSYIDKKNEIQIAKIRNERWDIITTFKMEY
jgi:hypothetical protein